MPEHRTYYPAFVSIEGKKCVVAGGGRVAERKVRDLLKAGASVRVISPELTPGLLRLRESGRIRHTARKFRPADTRGAFLIIAATDDMEINRSAASMGKGMLVNVVDRPAQCSFIVPSTLRRGPLTIAVSTSGASPAMARAIRQELEDMFGPEVGSYLEGLCRTRKRLMKEIKDPAERERRLRELGSPEVLKELLKGSQCGAGRKAGPKGKGK